jgi:hypothetical protein
VWDHIAIQLTSRRAGSLIPAQYDIIGGGAHGGDTERDVLFDGEAQLRSGIGHTITCGSEYPFARRPNIDDRELRLWSGGREFVSFQINSDDISRRF